MPNNPQSPNNDPEAFGKIGKVGIGDIDISEDEETLYVMSLNDKTVYAISTDDKSLINSYPVPDPGCEGGVFRPFAISYHQGALYVGGVCDAQLSQQEGDLSATVYQLVDNEFVSILNFPLDYPKFGVHTSCPDLGDGTPGLIQVYILRFAVVPI